MRNLSGNLLESIDKLFFCVDFPLSVQSFLLPFVDFSVRVHIVELKFI